MANSRVVLTPEFRMVWPNFVTATEYKEKGKGTGRFSYSGEGLFTEESLKKFRVLRDGNLVEVDVSMLLRELAIEKWPELAAQGALAAAFAGPLAKGWPLKRGDARAEELAKAGKSGEHYKGHRYMNIKSNVTDKVQPPALSIVNPDGKTFRSLQRMLPSDMEIAKMAFVGGNYAVAELNIAASEVGGLKYLTPYINSVRFTREGAKFGGQGGQLMSRFQGIKGGTQDHDPTDGLDAEIPF